MRISDWSSDVCSSDLIEHLLAKVQRPVEARRVVIGELGIGNRFADAIDHAGDLFDVRLFGLDPDQVGAVLKAGDAVKNARSEEHTSELQSLMRISYAVFCLKKKILKDYVSILTRPC